MTAPITREDIAEIYEQLGAIEMRKAQEIISTDPDYDVSILDRSFEFFNTADQIREIDQMRPLLRVLPTWNACEGAKFIRSESNVW